MFIMYISIKDRYYDRTWSGVVGIVPIGSHVGSGLLAPKPFVVRVLVVQTVITWVELICYYVKWYGQIVAVKYDPAKKSIVSVHSHFDAMITFNLLVHLCFRDPSIWVAITSYLSNNNIFCIQR